MAPRSMWNGTLAFGEVIFPVKLYSIVQERRVRFREVHLSDGGRIVHQRIGSESGEEVPGDRIAKAYELEDGRQVLLEDEEIAAARTGTGSKTIEIAEFVVGEQIDPIYYDRPYLIGAQPGGEHAYRVLLAALEKTGKVGIGRVVLRTREQLVALAPHEQALRMYTMRFADELVPRAELEVPALGREPSDRELDMAERLVETLEQTVGAGPLRGSSSRGGDGADRAEGRRRGDRSAGRHPGARDPRPDRRPRAEPQGSGAAAQTP